MHAPSALIVENIHKRFGDLEVLKGLSVDAQKGDVISVLGASGSGKSTFLRCINLLEIPDQGSITVGDETVRMKTNRRGRSVPADIRQVERIRTRLAMVFQQFNLWSHMTIMEN
ncbi:MAG: ATP-binding cassette domain-containing protein, partial [Desulfobacterales bacterium]|nr:ATP-binding cassette domain-containing protein [Desulfobacterales bacterium]